nr:putative pol polyprotein [Tanacetum cinerariifolium]
MRMEMLLGIHEVWDVVDSSLAGAKKNNFVKGIASKSATLGEVMSEHKLVKKFLTSLPRCFVHIVATLELTTSSNPVVLRSKTCSRDATIWTKRLGRLVRLNIPTRIITQAEEEDMTHTLKVMDEVEFKDVAGEILKTKYRNFVSKCPERNQNHEVNLNKTQEKGVNHEEGTFFMMNHTEETIFMNEEKYTPPKSESNANDEDDVWYFDNDASIKVSQGKDCIKIKQERYALKILIEAGMEDCNPSLCPTEPGLKLSKEEDEPEVEVSQYRKMVSCLRYLLHTRLDLTYSVGVVSRYMQSVTPPNGVANVSGRVTS